MSALRAFPLERLQLAKSFAPPRGILVVDDDPTVRSLLGSFFRQQGLFAWLASDGEEAQEIFENYHDEIAFVLMEMDMPEISGSDTLVQLKEIDSQVVCYLMTRDWPNATEVDLMESCSAGLVVKPCLFGFLAAIVELGFARL